MEEIKNKNKNESLLNMSFISNNHIPDKWNLVKLGEVAEYINGKAFKSSEWVKEGTPIIRIQNLNRENSEYNYCKSEIEKKYHVNSGDLLFAWSGTPDTSFGAHIWKGGFAYLNQHIFRIVVNERLIGRQYYLYALKNKIKEFVKNAHGTAGLAHITKSKFEESQIPLPPLAEQQRIVSKIEELFSELDKGIESLKTAQQQLKVYRQAVLKSAFEGKLTKEWRGRHPDRVVSEDIVEEKDSSLGELPSGWKWVRLGEVIEQPRYGTSKKCEYNRIGKAVLRIPNIAGGMIDDSDLKYAKFDEEEILSYSLKEGDILTIRSNGSVDLVGKCAIITKRDTDYLWPFRKNHG
ncbi:restriction endonuclease subunit S [Leptospira alstonii]|uniref:Type I restriction modification DNA specificity domain protein n=2 Tax=Leptospira alstonii TaxID=28452 RepID=M6CIA0_9LEPT|nr:restriction endonuclease subunit S [Leptospira alstonii]EMJ91454.1 type I restriction modification DNA specificity domain protein [Leptospira alstonii serovar Sichuan str. 79601]EQA81939.1 type I restriction modification DNA specificity domain protein [Leptospira alstonii serovar Pingchang str. 80-412]